MDLLNKANIQILVIEDNIDISSNISDFFEPQGYILDFAMNGIHGLHLAISNTYDVIILDLMLPGMDGITLCKKLREEAKVYVPVLMLTARDTLEDKIVGFESGADDYLVKPFALQELAARINVLANRAKIVSQSSLQVSDLIFDLGTLSVQRAGRSIELTKTCFYILEILMRASPNVVPREKIEEIIWGDMLPGSDALRSHIYTLRQKIDKPFPTDLIHTIKGIGYKITGSHEIS
jgi:DNA-binding response OmpR family regulator